MASLLRVSRLKSVDFPTLGRPTSTIVGFMIRESVNKFPGDAAGKIGMIVHRSKFRSSRSMSQGGQCSCLKEAQRETRKVRRKVRLSGVYSAASIFCKENSFLSLPLSTVDGIRDFSALLPRVSPPITCRMGSMNREIGLGGNSSWRRPVRAVATLSSTPC